jgi:hypothetical protein
MPDNQNQVAIGMVVINGEGKEEGIVKEVRPNDFLIDRPLSPDATLPFSAIESITGNVVALKISASMLDDQSWADRPPLTGRPGVTPERQS